MHLSSRNCTFSKRVKVLNLTPGSALQFNSPCWVYLRRFAGSESTFVRDPQKEIVDVLAVSSCARRYNYGFNANIKDGSDTE